MSHINIDGEKINDCIQKLNIILNGFYDNLFLFICCNSNKDENDDKKISQKLFDKIRARENLDVDEVVKIFSSLKETAKILLMQWFSINIYEHIKELKMSFTIIFFKNEETYKKVNKQLIRYTDSKDSVYKTLVSKKFISSIDDMKNVFGFINKMTNKLETKINIRVFLKEEIKKWNQINEIDTIIEEIIDVLKNADKNRHAFAHNEPQKSVNKTSLEGMIKSLLIFNAIWLWFIHYFEN